jgi:hypothetical protein
VSESKEEKVTMVAEAMGGAGGMMRCRRLTGRQINGGGGDGKGVEVRVLIYRGDGGCRRLGERHGTGGGWRHSGAAGHRFGRRWAADRTELLMETLQRRRPARPRHRPIGRGTTLFFIYFTRKAEILAQ